MRSIDLCVTSRLTEFMEVHFKSGKTPKIQHCMAVETPTIEIQYFTE